MLKFTQEHEWLRIDGVVAVVGISHHAQERLGDLVFVELPESGKGCGGGVGQGRVRCLRAGQRPGRRDQSLDRHRSRNRQFRSHGQRLVFQA